MTSKHVITAAHCIHEKNSQNKFVPADIILMLGRYNIKLIAESSSVVRSVEEIFVHPDWKNYSVKYDADIAVLQMNEAVEFTNFIIPVCLTEDLSILSIESGTVVCINFGELYHCHRIVFKIVYRRWGGEKVNTL